MHICFIVDNSLTMVQKTSNNELTFFDQVKYSLENVIKSLYRNMNNSTQQLRDVIHLFVTSSTQPISSYQQNHQMHVLHQIKNLQCTIPTFPAQVIESALFHLGKFRCLTEAETFLGYRQGKIFQPAIIFFITDNSNRRQMTKIHRKLTENKLQVRAQYKFITIKYCSASPTEPNLTNFQKFKTYIEKQKQTLMMEQIMKKMGGVLHHVYQTEDLINLLQTSISKFAPTLAISMENKEYKIYNKQIIKVQFPTVQAQFSYLQKLKNIGQISKASQFFNAESSTTNFFIETVPLPKRTRTQIPLPFEITPKHLNESTIIIDQFENLKFQVDFTKQYIGEVDSVMKYLFNGYQVLENKVLLSLSKQFGQQKRFPVFYQKKKNQYLIGYLNLIPNSNAASNIPAKARKATFQFHISFSNFLNLNTNIRNYKQRNPSCEQYFQNYISTLPIFYHKFLNFYLQNLNIILSQQTLGFFENINTKPLGITNLRFYEQKMAQKKLLFIAQKKNFQQHQRNQSDCCAIYSTTQHFQAWQKQRAKSFGKNQQNYSSSTQLQINKLFESNLFAFEEMKKQLGIIDYLMVKKVHSSSLKKEQQKYNVRRDDDQMDELVGDLLGNPFKKINKKVKIHDQAQSVWVQPEQVQEMKQMLQKQKQVAKQLSNFMLNKDVSQVPKTEAIYDQLAQIKQKIATNVKTIQNSYLKATLQSQINQNYTHESKNLKNDIENKLQNNNSVEDYQQKSNLNQSETIQIQNQNQFTDFDSFKNKQQIKQFKRVHIQDSLKSQTKSQTPQIIQYVNNKFEMIKSAQFSFPSNLVHNELYLKNKCIFDDVIKGNNQK